MDNQLRKQVKELREAADVSVNLAAMWANVAERTWRAWETESSNVTARSPSPAHCGVSWLDQGLTCGSWVAGMT